MAGMRGTGSQNLMTVSCSQPPRSCASFIGKMKQRPEQSTKAVTTRDFYVMTTYNACRTIHSSRSMHLGEYDWNTSPRCSARILLACAMEASPSVLQYRHCRRSATESRIPASCQTQRTMAILNWSLPVQVRLVNGVLPALRRRFHAFAGDSLHCRSFLHKPEVSFVGSCKTLFRWIGPCLRLLEL